MFTKLKESYSRNKKSFVKKLIVVALLFAMVLAIFIAYLSIDLSDTEIYYTADKAETIVGPIYNGFTVSQTFISNKRTLTGFAVKFATYMTTPEAYVQVILTDLNTGTVVLDEHIDATTIGDNAFRFFLLNDVTNCKDHEFRLDLIGRNENGNINRPTTLWTSSSDAYEGVLTYNGQPREYDLNLHLYSTKRFGFNEVLAITILVCVTVFFLNRFYISCINDIEPEEEIKNTDQPSDKN